MWVLVLMEDVFFSGGQDHFILGEPLMPHFYHRMDERLSGSA